jgi:hypothetical protein
MHLTVVLRNNGSFSSVLPISHQLISLANFNLEPLRKEEWISPHVIREGVCDAMLQKTPKSDKYLLTQINQTLPACAEHTGECYHLLMGAVTNFIQFSHDTKPTMVN